MTRYDGMCSRCCQWGPVPDGNVPGPVVLSHSQLSLDTAEFSLSC